MVLCVIALIFGACSVDTKEREQNALRDLGETQVRKAEASFKTADKCDTCNKHH